MSEARKATEKIRELAYIVTLDPPAKTTLTVEFNEAAVERAIQAAIDAEKYKLLAKICDYEKLELQNALLIEAMKEAKATKVNGVLPMKISEAASRAVDEINRSCVECEMFTGAFEYIRPDEAAAIVQSAIDSETRELREALKEAKSFIEDHVDESKEGYAELMAALSKAGTDDALKTQTGGGDGNAK